MVGNKGISPLIAAVMLIAFTTAIAGIMATWATTFVRDQTGGITGETQCVGALDIDSPLFNKGNVSITVKNTRPDLSLTTIKAAVEYADKTKNVEYDLTDYGVADPLPPASTDWAIINTSDSAKPEKISVIASNCPDFPAVLYFK